MNCVERMIEKHGRPLLGAMNHTYNPAFAEMAGLSGFHVLWVEMEHGHATFEHAASLCQIAAGTGMLSLIRIPDARRENVLRAAECGPDIIDLPMGNSPEIISQLVQHARYSPEGSRGFFGSSRAMRYGMFEDIRQEQSRINRSLCLMSQVETTEAMEHLEELLSVEGLDAIFVGPGDLSVSMGLTGEFHHPRLKDAVGYTVRVAKERGKLVALPCSPNEVQAWSAKGVDIVFCAGEVPLLRAGLLDAIREARQSAP